MQQIFALDYVVVKKQIVFSSRGGFLTNAMYHHREAILFFFCFFFQFVWFASVIFMIWRLQFTFVSGNYV